jgi:hypothetical protein
MSELRRLLGSVMFDRLCDIAGGTRVAIPKHYGKPPNGGRDTSKRLKRQFGEPLAILLVFHFGDSIIRVPRRSGTFRFDPASLPIGERLKRRKKLRRLARNKALSSNEVARRVGCSFRTVEQHRQRTKRNDEEVI